MKGAVTEGERANILESGSIGNNTRSVELLQMSYKKMLEKIKMYELEYESGTRRGEALSVVCVRRSWLMF
jgi:hypothetical protein